MDQSNPHTLSHGDVEFIVPAGCKVPIQTALMLVSLLNQLACCGRRVVLSFETTDGAYGYLSRMRFFESLAREVEVRPERPAVTGAMIHGGGNPSLVEIHEIPPGSPQAAGHLPTLLAASLRQSLHGRPDADRIEGHIGTVLTEVLDNVYQHSGTPIAGFVGLQPYKQGDNVVVAVSDSGYGLSRTIRDSVPGKFNKLTEADLMVKVFREGLSRLGHGTGRGGGLRRSAVIAIQYGATLHVRLPSAIVRLVPAGREYDKNVAHCRDNAPLLWGTHINFEFRLTH